MKTLRNNIFITLIILITIPVLGQSIVYEDSLFSKSLGRTMSMSIVVPSTYNDTIPIPILYLLHGFGGNQNGLVSYTNIEMYVEDASVLCVVPQGDNSFYINSISEPGEKYEDYIMKDLSEFIQGKYNIDTEQQSIAGFSMGGYGALTLAMRHPKRFDFVASFAGAVMVPGDMEILETLPKYKFATPTTDKVFGEQPNSHRDEHDPFLIYKKVSLEDLPYIFLFTGVQDYFPAIVVAQRELADSLNAYGAFYEYHELQGRHDLKTVDASMHILLERIKYFQDRGYKSLIAVLLQIVLKSGVEKAVKTYHELKFNYFDEYNFNENELNNLGYQLLSKDMIKEAIVIFKLNVKEYPNASNIYDSLGEAYMIDGNNELAIKNYTKSTELDPNNKNAIEMIKQLK